MLWAMVKQQRSERVGHFARKASCEMLPPACESSGDAFRYGKKGLQPCLTTQTLYRPPDHGVSHFQGQLLGCGCLGCGWFGLQCLTHSLLYSSPLEVPPVSGTPHRQLLLECQEDKSSPIQVGLYEIRELPFDYGCAVAECLTMQTIASCIRQGRFRGPFEHSESGTSDLLLPLRF